MPHTLISFLGKAAKDNGGQYRTANYNFNGHIKTTRFFGLALAEVLTPERIVILGTSGSMWDVLFENFAESDQHAEHWLKLGEAVANDSVGQGMLDICQDALSKQLGLPCHLKLIPYGSEQAGQIDILQIMAEGIARGDTVSLDLTHGLRHLPMLGLLSAMYLQTARHVTIAGIYYGALDRTQNGETPVMRLDGLLKIAGWITALHGFDQTGDIAPFAPLLVQEGVAPETAELLKTAAFHESVLNINQARKPLKTFAEHTKAGLPGIASLFEDSLNERIRWKDQNTLYERQREKAWFYLAQGDYVRAAMMGYEAILTHQLQKNKPNAQVDDYDIRQEAKEDLEYELRRDNAKLWASYKLLRGIRNSLAHTNRADSKEIQQSFHDEMRLKQALHKAFTDLLP
jgi:CRISPR-associated Csx2 family protein